MRRSIFILLISMMGGIGLSLLMIIGGQAAGELAAVDEAAGETIEAITAAGHFGGTIEAIYVQGNYLYIGRSFEFAVIDISNPVQPVRVGSLLVGDAVERITISGNYAYLAAGNVGLYIVDISNPAAPTAVGILNTPGFALDVAVANNVAFVADDFGGLRAINVANPYNPNEIDFLNLASSVKGVAVSGNYAYLAAAKSGLTIVNIFNPSSLFVTGSYNTPGNAFDVAVNGNFAYVADGASSGLRVVNVGNPVNPFGVGSFPTTGQADRVFSMGGNAYLADGGNGLRIIDVTTPTTPVEIVTYETGGEVKDVSVNSGIAYTADRHQGVFIVDATMLPTTTLLSQYQNLAFATGGIEGRGNYLYVGGKDGLAVLDTSSANLPQMVSQVVLSDSVQAFAIVDNLVYAALGVEGMAIVDISSPLSPTVIGWVDTPGFANDVAVAGGTAFVADFDGGMRIIDVMPPETPTEVGFFQTPNAVYGLALRNNIAYLADSAGLRLVNVTILNNPSELSFVPTPTPARDVVVSANGNYTYVANGSGGLRIVNTLNTLFPFEVGNVPLFGFARRVFVLGRYAYVSGESGGLRLVDVSNVNAPFETAAFNTPGTTLDTIVHKGYAWLADLDGGVYIAASDLVVAGRVVDHNNVGFSGVTVDGTAGRSDVSDGNGTYTITGYFPSQTYHLTPTLAGYTFAPPNRSVTVLDDMLGLDFVVLPDPVTTTVPTNTQTILSYLDVRGFETSFDFGAGTVTQTTAVTVTPMLLVGAGNTIFAGHGFGLTATQGGSSIGMFNQPVTINIAYSDLDVQYVSDEGAMEIRWWNGADWVDAAMTCAPASVYSRDLVSNAIGLGVCKSGLYGLFGSTSRIYLPVAFK